MSAGKEKIDLNALLNDLDEFLDDAPDATTGTSAGDDDDPYDVLDDYASDDQVSTEPVAVVPAVAPIVSHLPVRPPTASVSPPVSIRQLQPPTQIRQVYETPNEMPEPLRFPRKMSLTANPLYLRQDLPPPEYMDQRQQRTSADYYRQQTQEQLPFRSPSVMSAYSSAQGSPQGSQYGGGSSSSMRSSKMFAAPVNAVPLSRSRSQFSDMNNSFTNRGSMLSSPVYENAGQIAFQPQLPAQEEDPEVLALRTELERTKMELNDRHQMNQILIDQQRQQQAQQKELKEIRLLRQELEQTKSQLHGQMKQNLQDRMYNSTSAPAVDSWDSVVSPHISGPVSAVATDSREKGASDTASITSKTSTTGTKKSWFGSRSKSVTSTDRKKLSADASAKPKKKETPLYMDMAMANVGMRF
ncbi:UNVERIFIED_CONTAM: hypothetical protein HDU68_009389 [Siphonaria sp. JEL0065]|nr:hypothetical protein HDU68_009389 [Siphonaria sp. JEL0065]